MTLAGNRASVRPVSRFANTIRFAVLTSSLALFAAVLCSESGSAWAQKKKKKDKEEAPVAQPAGPTEEQLAATEEFKKGQEAEAAGDLDAAIGHYEAAFELYTDAQIQIVIGKAYSTRGAEKMTGQSYAEAIDDFEKAKAAWQKYIELAPEGQFVADVTKGIENMDQGIENAKGALAKQEEDERKAKEEEEAEKRRIEEEQRRAIAEKEGMQLALDGMVVGGIDQDSAAIARLMAGGLLGWGRFAFEGHLSFEGFLRIQGDRGVSARSVTIADIGMRYGFQSNRFTGPFVSTGAGFGLFSGRPRERKLVDDTETCPGFDNQEEGACAFSVDKNISTRLGFGWGFEANKDTTVAIRLEAMYWLFSVDDEQQAGAPPAAAVEKPQTSLAFMLGLEFMHWP